MELGIYTFGDITPDPNTGHTITIRQRCAETLAAAKLVTRPAFVGRRRTPPLGHMGEISSDVYEKRAGAAGPILVGSPQQIIDKLIYERELFAHDRFPGQVDVGGLPYAKVAKSSERSNCWQRKCSRRCAGRTR